MKKISMIIACLLAMMAASLSATAQEITITLVSGWNWISYPNAVSMDIDEALGNFEPVQGDRLKSMDSSTEYDSEWGWEGELETLVPGQGYMYYSARTEAISFAFVRASSSTVTTTVPTDITTTSAVVGGTVTMEMGNHIFARGICWGTEPTPDIDGNHITGEAVVGNLSDTLQGLEPNTTYYIRAYVVSDQGLSYGEELSFATPPIGVINSLFSVSDSKQVYFSQGNLQYIGSSSTPYWKFADNQWDILGTTTGQNSSGQNVDRDLFGWGTSGYNHGAVCYQPWSTSENNSDYYAYGNSYCNLFDQTGQADWGYNAISNGGNQENQWRTLTFSEWNYLLDTRSTLSGIRFAMVQVNNVNGVILLPDNWDESIFHLNNTNQHMSNYNDNIITASVWNILETAGVVFLPAAGTRFGTSVDYVGTFGDYWSSTCVCGLSIQDGFIATGYPLRDHGSSVRLVRNLPPKVSTLEPTNISTNTVTVGGVVSVIGGSEITECGVCWSTEQNPNIEGNHIIAEGVTSGEFTMELTDLVPNTTYYVRAYAVIDNNLEYGEELSFTTGNGNTPVGAIDGKFTINDNGDQVYFSQGNLQYIGSASTPYWKFADNQWDYLGTTTSQNSTSQNVDRDLFGWGTSGYNHGAVCYQPWSTSQTGSDYYAYGSNGLNLYDSTGMADWGYNPISNGGNTENQWRTLTFWEWHYVFNLRSTVSGIRYAKARVNGVNGVILLPDYWSASTYSLSNTNSPYAIFRSNVISSTQWATLENAGAVFLPAAGTRGGTTVSVVGSYGMYWSASKSGYIVDFTRSILYPQNGSNGGISGSISNKCSGISVRLVRNVE
jgi:hypothetical protein